MVEPAETVLRFLESLGRREEANFYLGLFRAEPKERFAAISVDANVARHASEAVTLDLRFLASLGLFPVVVLGLMDSAEAIEHAERLRRRLERGGTPATILSGEGAALAEAATRATRAETIPIVAMVPPNGVTGPLNGAQIDERFVRLGSLLAALRTRKLIFLHRPGGLRQSGQLVPLVNLTTDYEALSAGRELSRKERLLLAQSRRLVFEHVSHKLLVTISSPLDLLRELFTIKGAGTLLRKGTVIIRQAGMQGLDRDRLRTLLNSAFGRQPDEAFFERPASEVYIEEDYRGAAVLRATALGAYLTKFAVGNEAQGEGVGSDLWRHLVEAHPTFFWRARPSNPVDAWYVKQCDGMARRDDWNIFWRRLPVELIPSAIAYAIAQPIDIPPSIE
jgi:acetylglutamate kinase